MFGDKTVIDISLNIVQNTTYRQAVLLPNTT